MKLPAFNKIIQFLMASVILSACGLLPGAAETSTPPALPVPIFSTSTATPLPSITPTLTATFTPEPSLTPSETPTITPTWTPIAPIISAQFLSATTSPGNTHSYVPNEKFTIDVVYKNTGTAPWTPNYCVAVVYVDRGDVTYQTTSVCVGDMKRAQVLPGEKIGFVFSAFGSETLGLHSWGYVLVDPKGKQVPGGVASFYYYSH